MKPFFLSLLGAAFLITPGYSADTDFKLSCEWIVDGAVASSVAVETYNFLSDQSIEVVLPHSVSDPAMKVDFSFFQFDSNIAHAEIDIVAFEGTTHERPKESQPASLFDGTINFEWGKPTTVFTSKSRDVEKALVFTLTPPENRKPDTNGKELTEEEIGKLEYSSHISSGGAHINVYNGNPFTISSALVRIKSTDAASQDQVDRVYSVKLGVAAYGDEYEEINDSMRLSDQEYEITLEAAYR